MSNVIVFPSVRLSPRGRWWYGGRGFKTKEALEATLSATDKSASPFLHTIAMARR